MGRCRESQQLHGIRPVNTKHVILRSLAKVLFLFAVEARSPRPEDGLSNDQDLTLAAAKVCVNCTDTHGRGFPGITTQWTMCSICASWIWWTLALCPRTTAATGKFFTRSTPSPTTSTRCRSASRGWRRRLDCDPYWEVLAAEVHWRCELTRVRSWKIYVPKATRRRGDRDEGVQEPRFEMCLRGAY